MLIAARQPATPATHRAPRIMLALGALMLLGSGLLAVPTALHPARAWDALPGGNVRRQPVHGVPFAREINRAAAAYDLNPALLGALVAVESGFQPHARSSRGALGLTQILPSTWTELRRHVGCTVPDRPADPCLRDPQTSLGAGAFYLGRLLRRYDHDLVRALAAYNAGARRVDVHGGPPPFPETTRYLRRVAMTWDVLERLGTLPPTRWALIVGLEHWIRVRTGLLLAGGFLVAGAAVMRIAAGTRGS